MKNVYSEKTVMPEYILKTFLKFCKSQPSYYNKAHSQE